MGRWPEPVRDPLPVGLVTEADIDEALALTIRYLDDPEDPEFDRATFGFICAVRATLIECRDILHLAQIDQELHGDDGRIRTWERFGREAVARNVARRVIDDLRRWVPQRRF